jgi:hypothetical protein
MPSIVAPKPQRAAPSALYNYRSGLGSDYEIEHYHPPSRPPSTHMNYPVPPIPAAAPPINPALITHQATNIPSTSFYPQYMQSALISAPQQPHVYVPQHLVRPPSPPPLGNWPRPNAVMQPLRSKHDRPALGSTTAGVPNTGSPLRPRPSGPRRKLGTAGDPQLPDPESSGLHGPPHSR